ncbi:MAG: PQQ-binding-like beta-propeller repeat protein, partial [Methanoregula sp.]|nr:PQQ-binding-like beta-propeller repeat protein [Methanoregula sp.]
MIQGNLRTLVRFGLVLILFVAMMVVPVAAGLADTPWPKFSYDLNNSGQSPYNGPESNTIKWVYSAGGAIYSSSPTIGQDGTIYFGSYDNNIYAINPNGSLKWNFSTENIVRSSPTIGSDGTIYTGIGSGKIYAINSNGTLKWTYSIGNIFGSPTIGSDGTIYIECNDNNVYAINSNGTLKWTYLISSSFMSYGNPAIGSDGTIYIGGGKKKILYALNPNNTVQWT